MKVVRSTDAEQAFEEAWRARGEASTLIDLARRAACRGRLEEVDVCLVRLRKLGSPMAEDLERELHDLVRSVRSHPSFNSRRAS